MVVPDDPSGMSQQNNNRFSDESVFRRLGRRGGGSSACIVMTPQEIGAQNASRQPQSDQLELRDSGNKTSADGVYVFKNSSDLPPSPRRASLLSSSPSCGELFTLSHASYHTSD